MSRPLPDPVLFLDECLGSTDVPRVLRAAGAQVELLRERFASGTPDREWLTEVGRQGYVVLTKDKHIRRRRAEIAALMAARVAAFVLTSGNLTGTETAAAFARALPRLRKTLRDLEPPFVAAVDAQGRVTLLTPAVRRAARKRH